MHYTACGILTEVKHTRLNHGVLVVTETKGDSLSGSVNSACYGSLLSRQTTLWTAVLVAAQSQLPGSQAALSELCQLYWY